MPADVGAAWLSQDSAHAYSQPAASRGLAPPLGLSRGRHPEASFVSGRAATGVHDGATFIKQARFRAVLGYNVHQRAVTSAQYCATSLYVRT